MKFSNYRFFCYLILLTFFVVFSSSAYQIKVSSVPVKSSNIDSLKKAESISSIKYTSEQEYLFDVFKNRRSVRKFKSTQVPEEHILKIIEMACTSPTSGNQQPWKFLIIRDRNKINRLKEESVKFYLEASKSKGLPDPEKLKSLKERMEKNMHGYLSAPVLIIVLVDKNSAYPDYNKYDGPLAAGYLLLAARSLGYGTVFLTDSFPFDMIKKAFEIPDNFEIVTMTPVGIPEEWPKAPKKKNLNDFVAFEKLIPGVNFELPVKKVSIPLDTIKLSKYCGKYNDDKGMEITVFKENNQAFLQVTGQNQIEMYQESENVFFLNYAGAQIIFVPDSKGNIIELIIKQKEQEIKAKKSK